jgi:hypothetical protein
MYNELLSEADASKALEKNVLSLEEEINKLKNDVKIKTTVYKKTRRQFDVLEHVDDCSSRTSCMRQKRKKEKILRRS